MTDKQTQTGPQALPELSRSLGPEDITFIPSPYEAELRRQIKLLTGELASKTQKCEELEKELDFANELLKKAMKTTCLDCASKVCDENKKLLLEWMQMKEKNDRYRKALEEIEKELKEDIYRESEECGRDYFEECLKCTIIQIINIINKAKEGGND